ncbi:hypothetical protein HDU67_004403, partial [Dinochytrium kinnereticum]
MTWFRKKSSIKSSEELKKSTPSIHFQPTQMMTPTQSNQGSSAPTLISSGESRRSVAITSDERLNLVQKRYDIGYDAEHWSILPPPRMRRSNTAKRPVSSYSRDVVNGGGAGAENGYDAPRPSMQTFRSKFTFSMSQPDGVGSGASPTAPEYPLSMAAFSSIAKNPRFTYHSGPIDQRALTSREPTSVVTDFVRVLLDRGMEVRSTGVETGEFKIKVVRPEMFILNGQVVTGPAASAAFAAHSAGELNALLMDGGNEDGYDVARFSVDTMRTGHFRPSTSVPPSPGFTASMKERK